MAQRTVENNKKETINSKHSAELMITGTLMNVFVGDSHCYAEIHVKQKNNFIPFRVIFPLDFDFPDDNEDITVLCDIRNFNGTLLYWAK